MADFDEYEYEGKRVKIPKGTEPTEELLDSLSQEQEKIQKREVHLQKRQESHEMSELAFPRASKAMEDRKGFLASSIGALMDVASSPLRAAGALGRSNLMGVGPDWGYPSDKQGQPIRQSFGESLDQINQGLNPRGEASLMSGVYNDPTAIPLAATGIGAAGWILKGGKWLPSLGRATAVGAAEGLGSGLVHQAEDVALKGEKFSPGEVAAEAAASAAAPAAVGGLVAGPVKFGNFLLGKLASQLSNVSEATLRKWGTGLGKGAKELKDIHGKQQEIGGQILDALNNFDDYIPEKKVVDQALEKMPNISMQKTVETAKQALSDIPMQNTNAAEVNKLKAVLKDIESKGPEISAKEFKKLRAQIDNIADWNSPGAKLTDDAAKKIRRSMADEIITNAEASGHPEVAPAMKQWAEKLNKRDAILEEIGANAKTREKKVGQFLSTLFNKNKETKQKALADISEVFGEDFVKKAKIVQMSDEIIADGSGNFAKILPNYPTGKAGTALSPGAAQIYYGIQTGSPGMIASGIGTAGAASPMIGSKMLSAAELADWMSDRLTTKQIASQVSRSAVRNKKDKK